VPNETDTAGRTDTEVGLALEDQVVHLQTVSGVEPGTSGSNDP
jgi:uncharacterized membrane protein